MSTAANVESFLRSHNFKQRGNTWRGNTPGKPDSDSQACVVTIEGPENGAYINFATGTSGSLYEFCEANSIDKAERVPVATSKKEYTSFEQYATEHGAPVEAFRAARWMEKVEDNRRALAFDTDNGIRYRFLDGQKPPYKSPAGYKSCWYGLKRAVGKLTGPGKPLVLVNGEASTVVCQHWGIPAACTTSGGERKLSDELLKELREMWSGQIIIAMDCDSAGRTAAEALRAQLADYSVAVVDLGLTDGGDAANWCLLHKEQSMAQLMARTTFSGKTQSQADNPKYVRSGALMKQVSAFYRKVQTGDARLTLPTGIEGWDKALMGGLWSGLNFIAGPMGSGKSTLASSIVGNWTRLGKRGLIVATEMTPGQWITRVWAHLAGVRTDELMLGNFNPAFKGAVEAAETTLCAVDHIWRVEGMPTVAGLRDDVLRFVSNNDVDFIVVDSSSNMHADNVSGSIFDQTKAVTNQLAELSREAQAIVGDGKPVPFLVTHQQNAANILKRSNKTGTMMDSYGGQSPAQDATTYTVINYPTWFVDRDLAEYDPEYPPGVAALVVDKHRFFMNSSDKPVRVRYEPGMGFYGDRVKAPAQTKPRVLPSPRRDLDDHDDPLDALYGSVSERTANIEF